jgi:hypothetical protein
MALPSEFAGQPPNGDPDQLVRVLTATALAAQFVALVESNPTAAATAGMLAWTIRVLLDLG